MAHTILGIDLGSSAIKLAQLEARFRSTRLLSLTERPLLPPADEAEPLLHRQLRTLAGLLFELGLHPEMCAVALSETVTLRVVGLPLSDPRKIEQVLPYELEGQLLEDIEEHVVDHTLSQTGLTLEEGQPGQGVRVLAAAAPKVAVRELLDQLGRLEPLALEPRLLGAAALSCVAVLQAAPDPLPAMLLSLGHTTTQLCVVHRAPGGPLLATYARTISRGGLHLTQALARGLGIDEDRAAQLKHEADLDPPRPPRDPRIGPILLLALRPLVRDLRQTLASYMALYGEPPRQVLICGGASRLRSLQSFLSRELGLPVAPLPFPEALLHRPLGPKGAGLGPDDPVLSPLAQALVPCAEALGLALAVAAPAPQVNLRKGEFAYRTDYSFLREKAPHLALSVLAVLLCAILSGLLSMWRLDKEAERLSAVLRSESMQLFDKPRTDGEEVSAELSSVIASARGSDKSVPTVSAFDLLDEISRAAPPLGTGKERANLDVTELSIRPKKTDIKGTASTAQYVDVLAAALSKIPCFKHIEEGKTMTVRNTGPDGKPVDVKQFSFSITTTCP